MHRQLSVSLILKLFFGLVAATCILLPLKQTVYSEDDDSPASQDELDTKKAEIEELKSKLDEVRGEKQTLASTINYINSKIALTQAQIDQTQSQLQALELQINDLSLKITDLDASLEDITEVLVHRISDTYKRSRLNPLVAVITNDDLSRMLSHYKYLQTSQRHDREILIKLETTRFDYDQQKTIKEEKQQELDALSLQLQDQQVSLEKQQREKQFILEQTKNDEKRFQSLLSQKLAELEAIQSIIAGKGDETEVGDINEGATIAQVISGPSACSSGAHLHFEVAYKNTHRNPAEYLSSKDVVWDNKPDGEFGFSGSWSWPVSDPVRITQGYGMTFYAATMRYYGGAPHTGIDMVNNGNYTVKSVKSGKLYRGAIACGGGTLRYVRVKHDDDISTFYLHVNY